MTLPRLTWTNNNGVLAVVLGVTDARAKLFDDVINAALDAGCSLREVLDAIQNIFDVTFNEWTAIIYALGVMDGMGGPL